MPKIDKKIRILVLGGTGFIGQNLVKELLKQGRNVNLLVYGEIPPFFKNKKLNIFKGDIADKKTLEIPVKNSDILVNLVGSFFNDIYSINVMSSCNLMEVAKEHNISKIIFTSSEAVYGEYPNRPYKESDPPKPITEYGLSKYLAERMYEFYSEKFNIPTTILRLSNTYGPGQKMGVIHECLSSVFNNQPVRIHRDGNQRRDFLYVDDAVNGIIKSIDHKSNGINIFNVSGGKTYSLLELISSIENNIKRKIEINFMPPKKQDIKCMCASCQKAGLLLKYEPKTDLRKGIAKIIDYYKNEKKNFIA